MKYFTKKVKKVLTFSLAILMAVSAVMVPGLVHALEDEAVVLTDVLTDEAYEPAMPELEIPIEPEPPSGESYAPSAPATKEVAFFDWDGTWLKTDMVPYGGNATAPTAPARNGYTFLGWDTPLINITANINITAVFSANAAAGSADNTADTDNPRVPPPRDPAELPVPDSNNETRNIAATHADICEGCEDEACSDCGRVAGLAAPDDRIELIDRFILSHDETTIVAFLAEGAPNDIVIPFAGRNGVPITAIGDNAFAISGLTRISFASGSQITTISAGAFLGNQITEVANWPSNLQTIGNNAFQNNRITVLNLNGLPISTLGTGAFMGNAQLHTVDLRGTNITQIGTRYDPGCGGISPEWEGPFQNAFALRTVHFPEVLQTIGLNAFRWTAIQPLNLHTTNVSFIGEEAFRNVSALTTVNWPSTLQTISAGAFFETTGLTELNLLGTQIETIGGRVGAGAFESSGLVNVHLPSSLQTIGTNAFRFTRIEVLNLATTSVSDIGPSAFYRISALHTVHFPTTLRTIGSHAFAGALGAANTNNIQTLDFSGTGIETIGALAFNHNRNLMTIIFPSTLETIGDNAFTNIGGTAANRSTIYLTHHAAGAVIGSPWGAEHTTVHWRADEDTGFFTFDTNTGLITGISQSIPITARQEITIPNTITIGGTTYDVLGIAPGAFSGQPARTVITSVLFQGGSPHITEIPHGAFAGAANLVSINMSNTNITAIHDDAFATANLHTVHFPDSLETIGNAAFRNNRIMSLTLGNTNVTSIGNRAFQHNVQMTSAVFPQYLEIVGNEAFAGTQIVLNVALTNLISIGVNGFTGIRNTALALPASLQTLGSISGGSLASVTFSGSGSLSLGSGAFADSANLRDIFMGDRLRGSVAGSPWGANLARVHWMDGPDLPNRLIDHSGMWEFSPHEQAIIRYLGPTGDHVHLIVPNTLRFDHGSETMYFPIRQVGSSNHGNLQGWPRIMNSNSRLGSLTIADGIEVINVHAFRNVIIGNLNLGSTVTEIGGHAFDGSGLAFHLDFPGTVTYIGSRAFMNNALPSITLPNNIAVMNLEAFQNNRLTTVALPSSLTRIEMGAFANNNLQGEIRLPGRLEYVAHNVFAGNTGITRINVRQFRVLASDPEGYNPHGTPPTFISSPDNVRLRAPWGAGTPGRLSARDGISFVDDPRPDYTIHVRLDSLEPGTPGRNTVTVTLSTRLILFRDLDIGANITGITAWYNTPGLTNVNIQPADRESTAQLVLNASHGDGTYEFVIHFWGMLYRVFVTIDEFDYTLTFRPNNATGSVPTSVDPRYIYRAEETLPGQGNLARGEDRFLGWSKTQFTGQVTTEQQEASLSIIRAGDTYVFGNTTYNVTLYAVWAHPTFQQAPPVRLYAPDIDFGSRQLGIQAQSIRHHALRHAGSILPGNDTGILIQDAPEGYWNLYLSFFDDNEPQSLPGTLRFRRGGTDWTIRSNTLPAARIYSSDGTGNYNQRIPWLFTDDGYFLDIPRGGQATIGSHSAILLWTVQDTNNAQLQNP